MMWIDYTRKEEDRGLEQLKLSLKTSSLMLKLVKKYDQNKPMYSITSDTKKYLNGINLSTENISENSSSTEKVKQIKTQAKTKIKNSELQ